MTRLVFVPLNKSIDSIHRLVAMLFLAVVAVALSACSSDGDAGNTNNAALDANSATVEYSFVDSSVPPEFHRSFTITSDANTSRLTIDSYGNILDDANMATNFDALSLVLTRLEQSDLSGRIGFSTNCVGGRSSFLSLYRSSDLQTPVRSIGAYECDSAEAKEAMPELRNIIDPVLEPFDVESLINNTRQ